MNQTTFSVDAELLAARAQTGDAERLDRWLAAQFPEHSRSSVQRWIKEGHVLVNGRETRANYRLTLGDTVTIDLPDVPRTPEIAPEAIPLAVLYEDNDIIVIDKPAGLVVHPAPGHRAGTLVNALLHYLPDLGGIGGEARPGVVHRLDKDTSGVMVVAKHEAALRHLQAQFKSRKVEKHYLALVEGRFEARQGSIVAPIGRDPRNRKRMAVIPEGSASNLHARPSMTEYEVIAQYTVPVQNDLGRGTFSLVDAHPITGRTHQIRVHFASEGHPLVGDPIYGLKRQRLHAPRLFLHAVRLSFALPGSGQFAEFTAPLPHELQALLDQLEQAATG